MEGFLEACVIFIFPPFELKKDKCSKFFISVESLAMFFCRLASILNDSLAEFHKLPPCEEQKNKLRK